MKLAAITELFMGFEHLSLALEEQRNRELVQLFNDLRPLHANLAMRRKMLAERFNVFEALGQDRRELTHSAFLAYLLRPTDRHDQGASLLKAFLRHMQIPLGPRPNLETARVVTEYTLGIPGRIDVIVFLPDGRIIALENKVDSDEGDQQILRYQKWLSERRPPQSGQHELIFLTPEGRKPAEDDISTGIIVRCCSYKDLHEWLSSLPALPQRLKVVVDMYGELCGQIGRL